MMKNNGKIPLRAGFRFDGYGENGEAKWEEIVLLDRLNTEHNGADDRLVRKIGEIPLSVTDEIGDRGEAVYTLKTVYTDVTVDGERDAAYDYGLHFKGAFASDAEYYRDRETCIEVYMIRSQDGRIYVYGEITDPDIVVNEEIMGFKPHYCDGLHAYVDHDNYGQFSNRLGLITADESGKYIHRAPRGCVVKMTDKGFRFEYSFDNLGKPFLEGDMFGFNFFYNDTNEYVDLGNYKRGLVKLPSRLNPEGSDFITISAPYDDAIRVTEQSAVSGAIFGVSDGAEACGVLLKDILSGAVETSVIWRETSPAHTVISAKSIVKTLRSYGVKANFGRASEGDAVIYLGGSDDIDYNEYRLSFGEKRIELIGWMEEAVGSALGMLASALDYVYHGGDPNRISESYGGRVEDAPSVPKLDDLTTVTDAGDGAYLLLKSNAAESDLHEYTAKLTESGYTLYTENKMVSVYSATYQRKDSIVSVTYGEKDGSLRAVAEPVSMTFLPLKEREKYTPVCSSSITQLSASKMIWMCYVVKLDNGEYIVIDSGGNRAGDHLYTALMNISGGEDITVAAWIFTHFHQDHIGGFVSLVANDEYMKRIKIRSIIYNFPQKQVLDTAKGVGDRRNVTAWDDTLKRTGAALCQARTGQKHYIGNAEIEMIFTYEDLMPFNIYTERTNPTSSIFTLKIEGQKFMMMGDACQEAADLCILRYGKELRSDFVQLSHHGWGDIETPEEFYKLCDAPYVLLPNTNYCPRRAEELACNMARKCFFYPNEDYVISLPYSEE